MLDSETLNFCQEGICQAKRLQHSDMLRMIYMRVVKRETDKVSQSQQLACKICPLLQLVWLGPPSPYSEKYMNIFDFMKQTYSNGYSR